MTRRATFTEIADWVEGRLPAERAREVAALVRDDQESAEAAGWVAEFLATAQRLRLEAPPPDLRARLRGLFDDPANFAADRGWSRARLLYDTRDAPVAGVRRADQHHQAHLAFESEAGRFVLEAGAAVEDRVELRGLLLADRPPVAAEVSLLEGGTVRRRCSSSADGRFDFGQVPTSVDELRIAVDGVRVSARLELARA